jgi:hypothetical protein
MQRGTTFLLGRMFREVPKERRCHELGPAVRRFFLIPIFQTNSISVKSIRMRGDSLT